MAKILMKGNDAVIRGAVLSGCRMYFGYPITPASEIAEAAANYIPKVGGTFLQAESEVAAINMVYGAASGGMRVMTASSSPGISLKQEGVSYAAGAELPCVIVDIMRGGPGLGNIAPEQGDYNQIVKGGGHGNYKCPVLAPNSGQEMCDLTRMAFDIAEKYRTPVYVLADGYTGQMMEPVEFGEPLTKFPRQDWAVYGDAVSKHNLISSIYLDPEELEEHNLKLQKKYQEIEKNELRYEEFMLDDTDYVVMGFGIVSRILKTVVEKLREDGMKIGLLRPITLFPFPKGKIADLSERVKKFLVVEMNNGQMVDDVRLAVMGKCPVEFYGRMGGVVPSMTELYEKAKQLADSTN
ncbi:MAG: 3-methyl-2-oxobutanoate dehydrogenase subunit VorB [Calditrichaceae bacterium]|nr:3-methyl-2-oxobutanoate dehydrogenase subunit VorB [Calditrichaceae bacterium]